MNLSSVFHYDYSKICMKTLFFLSVDRVNRSVEQQIARITVGSSPPHPQYSNIEKARVIDWQSNQTLIFSSCLLLNRSSTKYFHQYNSWKKVSKGKVFAPGFCQLSEKFGIILHTCQISIKFCYSTALLRIWVFCVISHMASPNTYFASL